MATRPLQKLPIPPRSGSENRDGLKNVVQNLVQLSAEEAPICRVGRRIRTSSPSQRRYYKSLSAKHCRC